MLLIIEFELRESFLQCLAVGEGCLTGTVCSAARYYGNKALKENYFDYLLVRQLTWSVAGKKINLKNV